MSAVWAHMAFGDGVLVDEDILDYVDANSSNYRLMFGPDIQRQEIALVRCGTIWT